MAMIKPLSDGSWWLSSKTDPRWNCNGRCECGAFVIPNECKSALEKLKEKFGEQPSDLEYGYMKD